MDISAKYQNWKKTGHSERLELPPDELQASAQMSSYALWLCVEGKNSDIPFYDGILDSIEELNGSYVIHRSDKVRIEQMGTGEGEEGLPPAGGKDRVALLHQNLVFKKGHTLTDASDAGATLLFVRDRDEADLINSFRESRFFFATRLRDVEAEIFVNCDITRSVSQAFGVQRSDARQKFPDGFSVAREIAREWREWILLIGPASCVGLSSAGEWSAGPRKKDFRAGTEESDKSTLTTIATRIHNKARTVDGGADKLLDLAGPFCALMTRYENNKEELIVSGKWFHRYIDGVVADTWGRRDLSKVTKETLLQSAFGCLDFQGEWADYYRARVRRALIGQDLTGACPMPERSAD